ncbi:KAP family P-loop NTPase fold protein [Phaeobacter italicus]|uniref:KAP family P-loop NTPase fold protein n=1 Tax=Phaeobacter italicus TaxID=481446 RepID=UPI00242B811B|nr:P-loop NTPase fold protein [Phaeobacter italicus]MCI5099421.1 KAP family NTPase [Phaeobacter italicus]
MRLTVPEPKIDLYNDGFADHDQLGRKATGDKLSDLVERIDDPMVIALDGAWGSGKSFFLKCWVGEHLKRKGNTTQTVYFDAFGHDFLDDPLIALTGAIAERFESAESREENQKSERSKKIKKAAWAVGKGALRIGASVATFGATEALSDMGDAVANAVGDETQTILRSDIGNGEAEKFWTAHEARIAAMKAFRIALTELTEPVTEDQATEDDKLRVGNPTRKLVVVVDELDRCRPDYALSLLEIIKHFFNVPGVHFVLGVNLTELQNSVRARYGSGVDAARYLRKFVTFGFDLPSYNSVMGRNDIAALYFEKAVQSIGANGRVETDTIKELVRYFLGPDVSLRDAGHIATNIVIAASSDPRSDNHAYKVALACLICLYTLDPVLFSKIMSESALFSDLREFFRLPESLPSNPDQQLKTVWRVLAISCGHVAPTSEHTCHVP